MTDGRSNIFKAILSRLYGEQEGAALTSRLDSLITQHLVKTEGKPPTVEPLSERDVIVITYGDMVRKPGEKPLATLASFLLRHLKGTISGVHVLPFFPYSSDDGFSVIDYREIDAEMGEWSDIHVVANEFRLMVDAVINHVSAQSAWFQAFLAGDSGYRDYFITLDPATDLNAVVRPRDLPLLTPFETSRGQQYVWTTFSADQIDLNYANPDLLLEILDLLLFYVRHGAQIIRLDAIAFLWKDVGTSCIHLPQTHLVVQLIRAVLECAAPWVHIITETNVPHAENLSYFGNGYDEAHLVYQFALPPLVLHTLLTGDASHLTAWASDLKLPSDEVTYFNFLASHDGIGLRPVQGILNDKEIDALIKHTEARGGAVSYRHADAAERMPYELNINYFDAICEAMTGGSSSDLQLARFFCSQAIMFSLIGVPGVYFHSLFGSRNDPQGVKRSGQLRAINREKLDLVPLEKQLADPGSIRAQTLVGFTRLLRARRRYAAFDPYGEQQILDLGPSIFAVMRRSPRDTNSILCLHEISGKPMRTAIDLPDYHGRPAEDVLSGEWLQVSECSLAPYQVRWVRLEEGA